MGENKGGTPVLGFNPNLTYKTGNHTFGAGVVFQLGDPTPDESLKDGLSIYHVKFPVSWTYRF